MAAKVVSKRPPSWISTFSLVVQHHNQSQRIARSRKRGIAVEISFPSCYKLRYWYFQFGDHHIVFPISGLVSSIRLLDPKNMGIVTGILLLSLLEAEILERGGYKLQPPEALLFLECKFTRDENLQKKSFQLNIKARVPSFLAKYKVGGLVPLLLEVNSPRPCLAFWTLSNPSHIYQTVIYVHN